MRKIEVRLSQDIINWINSEPINNRVKNGAVYGYFGSFSRKIKGAERAFYVNYLKAEKGVLKFDISFMNTRAGRKLKQVLDEDIGSFSLVIHNQTTIGIDYVLKPPKYPIYVNGMYENIPKIKAQTEEDVFFMRLIEIKDSRIERLKHLLNSARIDKLDFEKMISQNAKTIL